MISLGKRGRKRGPDVHLWVVVGRGRTTILPWSGRPTGCLPGSLRRPGARCFEASDYTSIDSSIEPKNVSKNCG